MTDAPAAARAGRRRAPSVRVRLALWFGLGLVLVVAVYALAVLRQFHDDLYEALDAQLRSDLAVALRWPPGPPAAPAPDAHRLASRGEEPTDLPSVEVWSVGGRLLRTSDPDSGAPLRAHPPDLRRSTPSTIRLRGAGPVRVLAARADVDGQPVIVRVARDESGARQELREMAWVLVGSLPVAFLLAAGAGYLLAGRALSPVAAMTARAREITADRLSDRLPIRNPDDEFGRLATVINGALARLEASFTTLRRFTADASHELRTPLTAIRSVGEVGLRERRTEAEYREIIGSILEDADRLTAMVDSLLTLSRADAAKVDLQPLEIDLLALAREVVEDLGVLAEEKRQALAVADGSAVPVVADRATLRMAVINLVDNAVEHCPEGIAIRITVRADQGRAVLEVADQGPGIAAEHLPRVFDRFYRVDQSRARAGGGAGLGLAIAKWAVEVNGGRLEVESEVSRGSVFRIALPLVHRVRG